MSYKYGLSKTEYQEMVVEFSTMYVDRVFDGKKEAKPDLIVLLTQFLSEDPAIGHEKKLQEIVKKYSLEVNDLDGMLGAAGVLFASEMVAETGRLE